MKQFVIMAKPVGSYCNMSCSYCYYLHAENLQDLSRRTMTEETLEQLIRSYCETCSSDVLSITWHGGEPTLAGLDFYRKAMSLEKKYLPAGKTFWNSLQTNGLLIDDAWCSFLKEHHFDVGVSIDGTRFVHDTYRNDRGGEDTYQRALSAVERLKKHGIRPDLLCTVTRETAENAKSVYRSLRSLDTGWIQFIPIVRRDTDENVTEDSVTPDLYGKFLKTVFREWFFHDLGRINIQLFAETALTLSGKPSNVCWMQKTCGNVIVCEQDGSLYACDHFVRQSHRIGSLAEGMEKAVSSPFQTAFGLAKEKTLSARCRSCPYLEQCRGCCPKDRFLINSDGEPVYYLCEGLLAFYDYAVPLLKKAMAYSSQGKTPAQIMKLLKD